MVPGWSGYSAGTLRSILVPSVCGYSPVMDYLPNTLQSTPTDEISPDEHKARSGRYQEIVRKHIRNWRGQCRCDDGNITVIGRRFGDGGLSDRLIEIGIVPTHSLIWRPSRVADTRPLLPISRYGYCLFVADVCLCSEVLQPGSSWSSSGSGSM